MRPDDRYQKYVWFHVSNEAGSFEPLFDSFWFSHSTESIPREYKIVIPFSLFSKEDLMIRPCDQAVVFSGDYMGQLH